jgi:hypothetical protein
MHTSCVSIHRQSRWFYGCWHLKVVERFSTEVEPQESFERCLRTKHEKMGHIRDLIQDQLITEERAG